LQQRRTLKEIPTRSLLRFVTEKGKGKVLLNFLFLFSFSVCRKTAGKVEKNILCISSSALPTANRLQKLYLNPLCLHGSKTQIAAAETLTP
jgi:hypothetical protein